MILWDLFSAFWKVGCFSFGGAYGSIPLIREVVLSHGWLTDERLTYLIAVSESTPGPIMVNLATYIGSNQAGFFGAVLATIGVVLPSFLVILAVAALLRTALKNPHVQGFLRGVKPCLVGVICSTGLYMTIKPLFLAPGGTDVSGVAIAAVLIALSFLPQKLRKKPLSPIAMIVTAGAMGMALSML